MHASDGAQITTAAPEEPSAPADYDILNSLVALDTPALPFVS